MKSVSYSVSDLSQVYGAFGSQHFSQGNDWRLEYEEGLRHYSEEALRKVRRMFQNLSLCAVTSLVVNVVVMTFMFHVTTVTGVS